MSVLGSENHCQRSGFFDSFNLVYTAGELAIDAFGLLASLSIAGIYLAVALSRRHTQKVAPWWLFGTATLFSLIGFSLRLISDVLYDCEIVGQEAEISMWITSSVLFYGFTYLLWLAVLLFPLTLNVLELANMPRRVIAVGLGLLWALVVLLWIGYSVCSYTIQLGMLGPSLGLYTDSVWGQSYRGLNGAFTVFYFVATLVASVLLIVALTKLRGDIAVRQGVHISVYITVAFFLASNILSMVETFYWTVSRRGWTPAAIISTGILDIVFLFGAAYGMLFTAGSRTWAHQTAYDAHGEAAYGYSAVQHNGQPFDGAAEMSGHGRGPTELAGNGRSTLFPYAPTSYHKGYGGPSELASSTVTSELGGQARYEAPGHPIH